ncbi:MAG TPA: CPBP family intramembrane metalloprotease [Candidatus Scatomonas pullistercoris]|uniref:CPBP family intramembrane metalloprotease n=1 Tax=Candidatus Scatomonas pullistercoris TaxID=2840920 RepID=A0A9D1P0H0_9FIRM|nr:CPBP family intramembrane metalloprotease [Candidatus Scatomonas pullistercoris]
MIQTEAKQNKISYEELKNTAPVGMEPRRGGRKPLNLGKVLLFFLAVMAVFLVFGSLVQYYLGMAGVVITELMFLAASLLFVYFRKEDFKKVFPLQMPSILALGGTAVLWLGSFLSVTVVNLILAYFFPAGVYGESGATTAVIQSIPWAVSFLIVAVLPAVCEEALHRGVIQYGAQNSIRSPWLLVLLMGVLFGCFHLSLWKFLPTAMLGAMMSYILLKTENMIYSCFFHFLHNGMQMLMLLAVPGLLIQSVIPASAAGKDLFDVSAARILPLSIGLYLCLAALVPFLLYLGNWMLQRARAGKRMAFFPAGKEKKYFWSILIPTFLLLLAGTLVLLSGVRGIMELY